MGNACANCQAEGACMNADVITVPGGAEVELHYCKTRAIPVCSMDEVTNDRIETWDTIPLHQDLASTSMLQVMGAISDTWQMTMNAEGTDDALDLMDDPSPSREKIRPHRLLEQRPVCTTLGQSQATKLARLPPPRESRASREAAPSPTLANLIAFADFPSGEPSVDKQGTRDRPVVPTANEPLLDLQNEPLLDFQREFLESELSLRSEAATEHPFNDLWLETPRRKCAEARDTTRQSLQELTPDTQREAAQREHPQTLAEDGPSLSKWLIDDALPWLHHARETPIAVNCS